MAKAGGASLGRADSEGGGETGPSPPETGPSSPRWARHGPLSWGGPVPGPGPDRRPYRRSARYDPALPAARPGPAHNCVCPCGAGGRGKGQRPPALRLGERPTPQSPPYVRASGGLFSRSTASTFPARCAPAPLRPCPSSDPDAKVRSTGRALFIDQRRHMRPRARGGNLPALPRKHRGPPGAARRHVRDSWETGDSGCSRRQGRSKPGRRLTGVGVRAGGGS